VPACAKTVAVPDRNAQWVLFRNYKDISYSLYQAVVERLSVTLNISELITST
jgi:hypothetical protein